MLMDKKNETCFKKNNSTCPLEEINLLKKKAFWKERVLYDLTLIL